MYYLNNIINLSIEKFALKFFEKTEYGSLSVEFPSGKISKFEGKEYGVSAKIKLKNFYILKIQFLFFIRKKNIFFGVYKALPLKTILKCQKVIILAS